MYHLSDCYSGQEQESNSQSNLDNTPKPKKLRNWFQNFWQFCFAISDKNRGKSLQNFRGLANSAKEKISLSSKELTKYLAFIKELNAGSKALLKFGARTVFPKQGLSFGEALKDLLTLREVERELKLSRTSVWRLRDAGRLRFHRLGGSVRILRSDLDRFISNELTAGRSR